MSFKSMEIFCSEDIDLLMNLRESSEATILFDQKLA